MYLEGKKLIDIAVHLNLPEGTARRWKCTHKWDRADNECSEKKKRGFQPGNKNSSSSLPKNKKAETYSFFSKYLLEETVLST